MSYGDKSDRDADRKMYIDMVKLIVAGSLALTALCFIGAALVKSIA